MLALCTTIGGYAQITGAGTVNFIPRFTASTTIGNSNIFQNGNYIGLFTTSPAATLEVGASCGTSNIGTVVITNNSSLLCGPGLIKGDPFVIRNIPAGGGSQTRFVVNSNGRVGIGFASPTAFLDVQGTSTAFRTIQARNATGNAVFAVLGNGNVAIGNITPTYLLDINGQQAGATQPPLRIVNSVGNTTLLINSNNRVGINLTNPDTYGGSLVVGAPGSGANAVDLVSSATTGWTNQIRFNSTSGARHVIADDRANNQLVIDAGFGGGAGNKVKIDGDVDITSNLVVNGTITVKGSGNTQFKIYADGKIHAREVLIDLALIPDYVFNQDYELKTIEQLQTYITQNKHLPNIPSQNDYNNKGSINLGELNLKLLEKVEELSLYIIQLNERIKTLGK